MKTSASSRRLIALAILFITFNSQLFSSTGFSSGKDSTFLITIIAGVFGFLAMLGLKLYFDRKEK